MCTVSRCFRSHFSFDHHKSFRRILRTAATAIARRERGEAGAFCCLRRKIKTFSPTRRSPPLLPTNNHSRAAVIYKNGGPDFGVCIIIIIIICVRAPQPSEHAAVSPGVQKFSAHKTNFESKIEPTFKIHKSITTQNYVKNSSKEKRVYNMETYYKTKKKNCATAE